jgi:hypothetical protein
LRAHTKEKVTGAFSGAASPRVQPLGAALRSNKTVRADTATRAIKNKATTERMFLLFVAAVLAAPTFLMIRFSGGGQANIRVGLLQTVSNLCRASCIDFAPRVVIH